MRKMLQTQFGFANRLALIALTVLKEVGAELKVPVWKSGYLIGIHGIQFPEVRCPLFKQHMIFNAKFPPLTAWCQLRNVQLREDNVSSISISYELD